jgi:hypothetical protein
VGARVLDLPPRRRPDRLAEAGNPVGWLLLLEGLAWELGLLCAGYVGYAAVLHPGSLPAPGVAAWVLSWIWAVGLAGIPLLLALFPDGLWPARRWRLVGVAAPPGSRRCATAPRRRVWRPSTTSTTTATRP